MTLMNWPPSRGPEPVTTVVLDCPGVEQKDVEFKKEPLDAEEAEVQEVFDLASQAPEEGKTVSEFLGFSAAPIPEDMTPEQEEALTKVGVAFIMGDEEPPEEAAALLRKPKPKKLLAGKFYCNYHVKTVGTLTLEQADRLLFVSKYSTLEIPCNYDDCPDEKPHTHEGRGDVEEIRCTWWGYEPRPLTIQLSYPLGVGSQLTIKPYTMKFSRSGEDWERGPVLTPGYVLWVLAQEYKRVYAEHERYKVWGHAIGDLHFEGFVIAEDGHAHLLMGS